MELIIVNEVWRSIDGFLNYQVSNTGKVRNANNGKFLKPRMRRGYLAVDIRADTKKTTYTIHRLVATTFIVNPDHKMQVDHIDNDKNNNCVNNLRWASCQDNQRNKQKRTKPSSSIMKNKF